MPNDALQPIHETVIWATRLRENSLERRIPIDLFYNPDVLNGVDILLGAGGYGEEKFAAIEGVRKFGELAIAAAFMVHPFDRKKVPGRNIAGMKRDEELRLWIEKILIEGPLFVASELNEKAGKPSDSPVDLYGNSMSAGGNIMSASRAPERFHIVEAQAPAGVNDRTVAMSESKRIHSLLRDMGVNLNRPEQNILKDRRNIRAGMEIFRRAVIDIMQRRFNTKVGYAVTADIVPDIAKLHGLKGEDFGLWLGSDDPVAQLTQVRRSLKLYSSENHQANLADIIRVYEGSHTALYANGIRPQLEPIGVHILERRKAS